MGRQSTPDVLGDLMSGFEIKQQSNKEIKKSFKKDAKKEKATFNLPTQLLGELESKWFEIRALLNSKKVSKTLIVEKALEMIFSDFDIKKHESKLYCLISKNLK